MNTNVLRIVITGMILISTFVVSAQDKIYGINPKRVIDCKVLEIDEELIRYSSSEHVSNLTFTVDKNNVEKIVFANGKEINFFNSLYGKEYYQSQRKQAIKFSFLTPLQGYSEFGYERSIKPGQSTDYGLAIIGLGWDLMGRKAKGAALRAGYKFVVSPSYYDRKERYGHILKGAYVKPELSLMYYSEKGDGGLFYGLSSYLGNKITKQSVFLGAVNIIGGKQWVYTDRVLIDLYAGVGYAIGRYPYSYLGSNYIYFGGENESPVIITCGFRVGWLF